MVFLRPAPGVTAFPDDWGAVRMLNRNGIEGLSVGESRTGIRIVARERWNPLNVIADPGETFVFSCRGRWWDADIESGPEGQPGEGIQRVTGWLKRKREAPWFCVIGSAGRERRGLFAIGAGCEWRNPTRTSAQLFAFANDAWLFYWNNRGEILLDVRRTE